MTVNRISPLPDHDVLLAVANTGHDGPDELSDPRSMERWWRGLDREHAGWRAATGTNDDLAALRSAREVIRAAALRNNDVDVAVGPDPLAAVPLQFTWEDGPSLSTPTGASLPVQVAGRTLLAMVRASARQDWGRVKACPGPDCGWVFVDRSRNGSRRWCQMSECGNRAKGAAFRERRRSSGDG